MVEASGASRIVVAETGNKRQNITDEDVNQCIKDLAAWFKENASAYYESALAPTANKAAADKVNAALAAFGASSSCHLGLSLQKFDGGFQYQDTFIGLSVDRISEVGAEKGLAARKILPFASDEESLLCLQLGDDGSESVIVYDPSEGSVDENL